MNLLMTMKYQPNRNYVSNDCIQTPKELAEQLVVHFFPTHSCNAKTFLEPCAGEGNILFSLWRNFHPLEEYVNGEWNSPELKWCEISKGKDFFNFNEQVDVIFTNPPWSQIRKFLIHSMEISNDIYFLITINHVFTKARIRDILEHNFWIEEICLCETPKSFPPSGFQLGMVHLSHKSSPCTKITKL